MSRKIFFILFTFLLSFSLIVQLSISSSDEEWVSCCASGCDYTWGDSKVMSGTTYYCCSLENGWSDSLACDESDNGNDPLQYGCTEDCSGFECDYCEDSDKLREYFCDGNEKANTPISCSSYCSNVEGLPGGKCKDGKCICEGSLSLSANPTSITTSQTSTITAQTYDNKEGIDISFSTTLGSLSPTSCTTDSDGKCSVTFSSSNAGTANITAVSYTHLTLPTTPYV